MTDFDLQLMQVTHKLQHRFRDRMMHVRAGWRGRVNLLEGHLGFEGVFDRRVERRMRVHALITARVQARLRYGTR